MYDRENNALFRLKKRIQNMFHSCSHPIRPAA